MIKLICQREKFISYFYKLIIDGSTIKIKDIYFLDIDRIA